jgi:Iap family predicted aminopeptidase
MVLQPYLFIFVTLSLAAVAHAQMIEFKGVAPGLLEQRLRLATPKTAERFARLRSLFEETGCTTLTEQKVKGSKEPNLICSEGGDAPAKRKILIGAHFDCAGGNGIIDNWTGAVLLPSLAEFMRQKPRRHSFEFIGFAAEERGLYGSKAYLKALSAEDRSRIAAVVTMDSLGLTSTKIWVNSSDPKLVRMAVAVSRSLKLDIAGVNPDEIGTTDSITFHQAGIPTLSLHSVTQETWTLINSRKDVWTSLSWRDYYDTHRFVSALLTYMDQTLP